MDDINKIIHDIRNPLNNIAINAELAKLLVEQGGDKQRIIGSIEQIMQQCKNCALSIDNLKRVMDSND